MKILKLFIIGLIAVTAATQNIAPASEDTSTLELEPIFWPNSQRPEIKAELIEIHKDGIEERIAFRCPDFDLLMVYYGDLKVVENSSRHSILLRSHKNRAIHFGISLFGKEEFLPDLEDENWNRYLESFKTAKPSAEIVYQSDRPKDRVGPNLFGKRVRQIAYELPTKEGELLKKREMFFFLENNLVVYTYSGSKGDIDRL